MIIQIATIASEAFVTAEVDISKLMIPKPTKSEFLDLQFMKSLFPDSVPEEILLNELKKLHSLSLFYTRQISHMQQEKLESFLMIGTARTLYNHFSIKEREKKQQQKKKIEHDSLN